MAAALVVAGPTSWAGEPAGETPGPEVRRGLGDSPFAPAVWVSHQGSFRFRPELLFGGSLGSDHSGVPAPLAASTGTDPDPDTLAWASIRLRYAPTLHLGQSLSVHVGFDALDNLVLGSTHANAGGDVGFDLFHDTAAVPSAGEDGWRDSLRVRHLYGRWLAFDAVDVRAGRMPRRFGLGVTRHDGAGVDADFGTVVDAVRAGVSVMGFRLETSWEFAASGATTAQQGELGQAKDLGQADDVSTYTIELGQRPVTDEQWAERARALDERRVWTLDWSVFTDLTDQGASSLEQVIDSSLECRPSEVVANGQPVLDYDCVRLYHRDAYFWRPGVWLKAQWRPDVDTSIRIEAEGQAVIGSIEHPQRLDEEDSKESKDIIGFGGALEVEYRTGATRTGIDLGFATGDDGDYLGVLDGQNIVESDDDAYARNDNVRNNRTVTSFWFNRDYRVDLILFRQIIGTVTNAVYFKPWIARDLLQLDGGVLHGRLDVLYAMAAKPDGTPGNGRHWGVEVDGAVGLRLDSGLDASLAAGVLLPLDALDDAETGEAGDPAFALRGIVTWSF
ncbi:MAG: hypothetical protein CSA66_00190 [Proteobacteria bacterium]|nr:MAG: hypothetical protein CSA66_00190 [Pseudomonadota bacterium]